MPYRTLELSIGQKFGMLTYIEEAGRIKLPSGQWNRIVKVRCDCGVEKNVRVLHLVRERMKSCGCIKPAEHGLSKTKLYRVWTGMIVRTETDTFIDHHRYKDRGIKMCDEWRESFLKFKEWAFSNGYRLGLQLDRVDNDKGYSPDNCRFVTVKENVNNREVTIRVLYNGKTESLRLILDRLGFQHHFNAIYTRIKRGWSAQRAIDTPIRKGNYHRRHAILSENNR